MSSQVGKVCSVLGLQVSCKTMQCLFTYTTWLYFHKIKERNVALGFVITILFFLHLPLQHHERIPGTARLTHCRCCRRTHHPALTAMPTGSSYSCWSSSSSSQTSFSWTSSLLCSGKSGFIKYQDKGCKGLSGCPHLLPHCWLFLLEYTCNFPEEYYLDKQGLISRTLWSYSS